MQSLLDELSSFSWDAKAVLTLLALSVFCTENWRHTQFEASDNLLCLIARLKGKPRTAVTKAFVDLTYLIKETLEFTKCIVEFGNYSIDSGIKSACISDNSYYIIVFVLGCSVLFNGIISGGNELRDSNLSDFSKQVITIFDLFKEQVEKLLCQKISSGCTDIVELMTALFSLTIYQCSERTTVKVGELKNKSVMLLISDLNLSKDDLATLSGIYNASTFKSENYEIMWVPIVSAHDEAMQKKFLDMRSRMQWYTCASMVSKTAAQFIQEKWQFRQQTKVVVLNKKGEVVNTDAMTMIRLWGLKAFPFTESNGNKLWNTQGINWLELVVNKTIHPYIDQCFEMKEPLFLYGSAEDCKTVCEIEEHLEKINGYSVSYKAIRISNKREQFLTRLENCISSKIEANSDISDSLTQEMLELYTNCKKEGGFAIVARGSSVVINARLADFATVLSQHQTWIKRVTQTQAFEAVFQEHYDQVILKRRCHHFYIPNMVDHAPKRRKCSGCSRDMKTAVAYECCHGEH
ncbi:hypothetical protein BT93_H1820 [Corymbia citriodora subsp. variegata]|nr:hypothetical protein BT93_H1820 [Corymbia citriodora subsp. variegata]